MSTPRLEVRCRATARVARDLARRAKVTPRTYPAAYTPADRARAVLRRTRWDAPASAEHPRSVLEDAADLAALAPAALADHIWHAAGGAIIVGPCGCRSVAAHRDELVRLARSVCDQLTTAEPVALTA